MPAESCSGVTIDGRRLTLVQFHWHRGSEHTLDGRRSTMELHLVHRDDATGAKPPCLQPLLSKPEFLILG